MSNITSPDSNGATKYFVNYNQDSTSLSIGSKDGFRLFSLTDAENIEQIYSNDQENIFMVERLFSSSLVALVATTSPRKLKVCHFKKGTEICNYSYSDSILSVKMNRARLVVCLVESLYIHNIRDMKVLHTIRDTPHNPHGLCALTINSDSCCLLAYPGSASIGELQIFDALNLQSKTAIAAHDSPLAAIAFNPSGSRVATASEKGTVIRVFQTSDGAKLFEFRRGARCVEIGCLSFSMCSNFLACSSNTETVHIFKLEELKDVPKNNVDESTSSWMGYLSSYLPSQVTDVFNQGRAFATAHLSVSGGKNVVTIVTIQNQPMVLVTTSDGILFVYPLDVNEGGDLLLKRQFRLYEVESDSKAVPIQDQADGSAILGSYAGIVKGNPKGQMSGTESDKMREMAAAAEFPPDHAFQFNDDQEYPPLNQHAD